MKLENYVPGMELVICIFVDHVKMTSGFKKLVIIRSKDKDMVFIDSKNEMIWKNEVSDIGSIHQIETTFVK